MKSDDLSLLTVQADGCAEIAPDTVVLTWNFLVQRPTADQVRAELERQGKELLAALLPLGFKAKEFRSGRDSFEVWSERRKDQWVNCGYESRRIWFLRFPVASGKLPKILDALQGFPVPMTVGHELSEPDRLEEESLRLAVYEGAATGRDDGDGGGGEPGARRAADPQQLGVSGRPALLQRDGGSLGPGDRAVSEKDDEAIINAADLTIPRVFGGPLMVRWENVYESWGWLDMRIGTHAYLQAGYADPFPGLMKWVEECCARGRTHSYHWDSEGDQFLFTYMFGPGYLRIEHMTCELKEPQVVWAGYVSRKGLCRAFYRGLMDFGESREFDAVRWCRVSLREWADRLSGGSFETVEDAWLDCTAWQIDAHLDRIDFFELYKDEEYFDEANRPRFPGVDCIPAHAPKPEFQWTRNLITLDPGWDAASREERKEMLKRFLALEVGADHGVHPRAFRSPELDAWWEENKGAPDP